jgi:hypothetical protein
VLVKGDAIIVKEQDATNVKNKMVVQCPTIIFCLH